MHQGRRSRDRLQDEREDDGRGGAKAAGLAAPRLGQQLGAPGAAAHPERLVLEVADQPAVARPDPGDGVRRCALFEEPGARVHRRLAGTDDHEAGEIVAEIYDYARLSVGNGLATSPVSIVTETNGGGRALNVDRVRIIQALTNLINNSIKFTSEGEISITTCVLPDKKFEIKITDTGPGVPPELLPRLFEKFVTKELVKTAGKQHGTGLGLFIRKSIIQAHGGVISAYNNPNSLGATFVVRLPIAEN